MADSGLSDRERRVLDEMEAALRRDRRLRRRLRRARRGRPGAPWTVTYRPRGRTVAALALLSLALVVSGIRTSEPGVIWAFAAVWPLTLLAAFRLLCRWTEP
ncbi:DUF3040 domain-containing protein [Streptomyces sp. G45]|uniref:DUF3040 domain-containing protein n=1 Tax=Streptomyces sp. G45 TaxID=3406627 RepID=UPI003C22735F